jgi:D-sedoheptulose 7-phosphate isomerase
VQQRIENYFDTLGSLPLRSVATDGAGKDIGLDDFFSRALAMLESCRGDNKVMFAGNGGSSTIASHIVVDIAKNAGIAALCFNDSAMLTALGNDEGVENMFSRQIGFHARPGDLLIAISSSGNSENITRSAEIARARNCSVVTMSGFSPDNRLRNLGDLNIYVPSGEYGFVELSHMSLCHALVDFVMGWTLDDGLWAGREAGRAAE